MEWEVCAGAGVCVCCQCEGAGCRVGWLFKTRGGGGGVGAAWALFLCRLASHGLDQSCRRCAVHTHTCDAGLVLHQHSVETAQQ